MVPMKKYNNTLKARAVYSKLNQAFVEQLPQNIKVTFVSQYSPMIVVDVDSSEISSLARFSAVQIMDLEPDWSKGENLSTDSAAITDAAYVRDTQGHKGSGVKIGQFEFGLPNTSVASLSPIKSRIYIDPNSKHRGHIEHATKVAEIMVAQSVGGYQGLAPSASLYCTDNDARPGIEWLISQGVNVINASVDFGGYYSTYQEIDRWIDHLAINHDVHFVQAVGNDGAGNVSAGAMAYNSIVVGGVDNRNSSVLTNCVGTTFSAYYTGSTLAQKPDLCAPAVNVNSYSYSSFDQDGTSYAAPQVTGIIAQLCSYQSSLKINQALVKSLLIAGVHDEYFRYNSGTNYQKYGAGIVDARGTRWMVAMGRYRSDNFTPSISNGTTRQYTFSVSSSDTRIRVALCFLKRNSMTGSHLSSTPQSQADLGDLDLRLTGPGGVNITSMSSTNNTEIIDLENPTPGTYTITVTLYNNSTANISYGVAWK